MPVDRIAVYGITARGFHGVLPEERRDGQPFIVDVELGVDLLPAAASDDLTQTVDYAQVTGDVVKILEGEPVNLIETLAERIAQSALKNDLVQWARVTVHKPQAPIAATFSDVAVTIERSKP